MNIRTKTILTAVALAAAASALGSQAADQSGYFEQQMQVTDGYVSPPTIQPTSARMKPETAHQAAENAWLEAERISGSTKAIPFPVPAVAPAATVSRPETRYQAAENAWLAQERNVTDGSTAQAPFASIEAPTTVAGR